jgi:7-cyano-7-deazaguanine reductase
MRCQGEASHWRWATRPGGRQRARSAGSRVLFAGKHGVFELLGDASLDDRLGGNLDRLACGRIAALTGLPLLDDELAEAREHELTGALQLFLRKAIQLVEEIPNNGSLQVELVREVREQFHLAHAARVCHACFSLAERAYRPVPRRLHHARENGERRPYSKTGLIVVLGTNGVKPNRKCRLASPDAWAHGVFYSLVMDATLDTFPNPRPERDFDIQIRCPEFTSVCPKTGQPDFGEIAISYTPDAVCIELKSLKFYLQSYRNQGIFYEAVTNKILDDLVAACRPRRMRITGAFTARGGITTTVIAEHSSPRGSGSV